MTKVELRNRMREQMKNNRIYIISCIVLGAGSGFLFTITPFVAGMFFIAAACLGYQIVQHTYACGQLSGLNGTEEEILNEIEGLL